MIHPITLEKAYTDANAKEIAVHTALRKALDELGNPKADHKTLRKAVEDATTEYDKALRLLHFAIKQYYSNAKGAL